MERFSNSKQLPYWVNAKTKTSTWTRPTCLDTSTGAGQGEAAEKDIKRRRVEKEVEEEVSEQQSAALQAQLDVERSSTQLNDPSLPRERVSVDMRTLVRRLHSEHATREDRPQNPDEVDFQVIFTLADEDVSHITRALQEDEILKTRLKLTRRGEVVDLPSFWDVWSDPSSPGLKQAVLAAPDPHEAKWSCTRQFGYKMATTFMPGYAKAVYQYFGAATVLDPCSGWGDRLLGASASSCVQTYVGFDPNKNLRPGYAELLRESVGARVTGLTASSLRLSNGFQVHSLPFEVGAPRLVRDDSCDLVFTSPPFFDYEMYNPENPQYRDWLKEFYEPLFQQAARCVKPHGFVCIHIGDTSAGEIVGFLKGRVHQICSLTLTHQLGLTGVMSKKVREVWVFRNTQAPLIRQPSAANVVSEQRKEWIYKLTNPAIKPREFFSREAQKSFILLDDGAHCIGGTKQRLLGRLMHQIPQKEVIYAGPGEGMAQVALAYTARMWGKKAVIFLNARTDDALQMPLVKLAQALGGDIRLGAPGQHVSLLAAEKSAQLYVSQDPSSRFLSPFGLRKDRGDPVFELFRSVLLEALCFVRAPPKRMWVVSGSGFIMDVLHSIWPKTKFMIVQVGRKIWKEVLANKQYQLFTSLQEFSECVAEELRPTAYRSVDWYDAKLWQFVLAHGEEGDFIWNVAAVPEDVEAAAREALAVMEQAPL